MYRNPSILLDGLALLSLLVNNNSRINYTCVILYLVVREDWQKVSLKQDSLPSQQTYFLLSHLIHQSQNLSIKICQVLLNCMFMCWVVKVLLRYECFSHLEATSATRSSIFILVSQASFTDDSISHGQKSRQRSKTTKINKNLVLLTYAECYGA